VRVSNDTHTGGAFYDYLSGNDRKAPRRTVPRQEKDLSGDGQATDVLLRLAGLNLTAFLFNLFQMLDQYILNVVCHRTVLAGCQDADFVKYFV